MFIRYAWLVISKAAQLVWRALVNYPVPALIGAVVYYAAVYAITWQASQSPTMHAKWADAMFSLGIAAQAFAWSVTIVFLVCVFVIAPYQLWKEQRDKADQSEGQLQAIGQERPLLFDTVQFGWEWVETSEDEGPALNSLTFKHQNRGARLLSYSVGDAWLEVPGEEGSRTIQLNAKPIAYLLQPFSNGTFVIAIPEKVRISEFPIVLRVNADYIYNTVPETRERLTGVTARFVLHGWKETDRVEGMYFDEQRER